MDYLDEQGLATFYAGLQTKFAKSPDWNENDSTSKNYIQNRTHFTEDPVVTNVKAAQDLGSMESNEEFFYSQALVNASDYPTAFATLFGNNASQYGISFYGTGWFGVGAGKNDRPTFLERYNETDKVIYSLMFRYYDNNNDQQIREFTRYAGTPNIVSDTNFEDEIDYYVLVPVEYQHETSLNNIDMIALMPSEWVNGLSASNDTPGPILIFNTTNSQQDATNYLENNDTLPEVLGNIAIMLYTYEQTIHTLNPAYLPPGTMRIFPGMIYHSADPTSPAELFGGIWELIEGKFLLGATQNSETTGTNILDTSNVALGASGGAATVTLTSSQSGNQQLTYVDTTYSKTAISKKPGTSTATTTGYNITGTANNKTIAAQNAASAHTNMPPFLAVYIWKCLEAPTEIVNNSSTRETVFIDVNSGDYILTSAIDSTVADWQKTCQSNTTMGWTSLMFRVKLASAISANTSTKIATFSSHCIDIIGKTYVFAIGSSGGTLVDVTLDSYDSDTINQGIFIKSASNLAAEAEIVCTFSFPVTH